MKYNLSGQTEKIRKKKENIVRELNPHSIKYTEVKNKLDELNNDLSLFTRKRKNAEFDVEGVEKRARDINDTLVELKNYSVQIDEALQKISEIGKEHHGKVKELRQKENDLHNEVHEVNSRLEEIKHSSGQAKVQNHVITELTKAQKRERASRYLRKTWRSGCYRRRI